MKLTCGFQSTLFSVTVMLCGTVGFAGTQELSPSGSEDDTAQLQAALSQCTNARKPCDVRLGSGVFYTDVLLVKGFHGAITGHGQGKTIIRPLAHRALRSTPLPFFAEPTLDQPYPVLLHFANGGRVTISKLTLEFPSSMTVMPYDFYLIGPYGVGITDSLLAAILVDGERSAELLMRKVTIIGSDNKSYYGSNLFNAVRFEGQLRFSAGSDLTRKLQHGRFVAYDNFVERTGNGFSVEDTNDIVGLAVSNEVDARVYALILTNLSGSKFGALRNTIRAELEGIFVAQTPERPPQTQSDYLLAQNIINVNENNNALDPAGGYDGIGVFDFAAYETPPRRETFLANVTIWDNDITVADNIVLNGISVSGDGEGDIRVIGNRIYGAPIDAGIFVDLSRGTVVARNDLDAVAAGVADIHLTATTRECRVYEPNDTVLDEGTGNQVIAAP
jgi:hypothetical protein